MTFYILTISYSVWAQSLTHPRISTDRPSVSFSASTVPKKAFQTEIGYVYTYQEANNSTSTLPNLALRYGLFKGVELRVVTDYAFTRTSLDGTTSRQDGVMPLQFGAKLELFQAKGALPKVAAVSQIALPKLASRAFQTTGLQLMTRLLFEHDLGTGFGLFYNIGPDIAQSQQHWNYTLGVSKSLGERASIYVEGFGSWVDEGNANPVGINAGFAYAPTNQIQGDVAFGMGLNDVATDWFGTIGFSFYLPQSSTVR